MIQNRIYPTCLPLKTIQDTFEELEFLGIYSGWSNPPPFSYVQNNAPLYASNYRDFSKQWHERVEFKNCKDVEFVAQYYFKDPSDTFYPPGVVCASQLLRQICPTSGESGSPLMTQEQGGFKRFTTEGILSFTKGCTYFGFGPVTDYFVPVFKTIEETEERNTEANTLFEISANPQAYTKLHCYLPWIAEQYDLDFEYPSGSLDDPTCINGTGNPEEIGDVQCTNFPSTPSEIAKEIEQACLFPYYVDGRLVNDTCFKFNANGFLDPVSRCPIWNVTTKINGINSYESNDTRLILGGFCMNDEGLLDPEMTCPLSERFTPFSTCKNNCRGGKSSI